MSISFQCPHCYCAYILDDHCAGRLLPCRQCGRQILAPRGTAQTDPGGFALGESHITRQVEKAAMPTLFPTPTRFLNQISRHLDRTIGPSPMVFHEIVSTDIHLDLHIVPPQPGRPTPDHPHGRNFYTIVTSGMSTRPMTLPSGADPECPRYAELMITLPAHWPGLRPDGTFVQEDMQDENNWWPIRWLKMIARLPHEHATYVGAGHTMPNGPQGEPFSVSTHLGCMLAQPSVLDPKADRLVVHDDLTIAFLALWPIYPEEMALKLHQGADALMDRFHRAGITDLINPQRKNVAAP